MRTSQTSSAATPALLAQLIDKADGECQALIFNQAPNDSKAKSLWFVHGIEYPEDYRDC